MPKTKKTDLQVLTALLGMPAGKLSPNEKTVFQRMYDDVAGGMVISLSKKQRAWIDGVYDKHDLDSEKARGSTPVKVRDKQRLLTKPKTTVKDQAELFRRRAEALGLPMPVPDEHLHHLLPVIPFDVKRLIEREAPKKGMTVEAMSLKYLRKVLG